jgi:hypothetical protein
MTDWPAEKFVMSSLVHSTRCRQVHAPAPSYDDFGWWRIASSSGINLNIWGEKVRTAKYQLLNSLRGSGMTEPPTASSGGERFKRLD